MLNLVLVSYLCFLTNMRSIGLIMCILRTFIVPQGIADGRCKRHLTLLRGVRRHASQWSHKEHTIFNGPSGEVYGWIWKLLKHVHAMFKGAKLVLSTHWYITCIAYPLITTCVVHDCAKSCQVIQKKYIKWTECWIACRTDNNCSLKAICWVTCGSTIR